MSIFSDYNEKFLARKGRCDVLFFNNKINFATHVVDKFIEKIKLVGEIHLFIFVWYNIPSASESCI